MFDRKVYAHEYYLKNRRKIIARTSEFYKNHRTRILLQKKNYRAIHPYGPTLKAAVRKSRTGWTQERYDEYLDAQEGACAICDEQMEKPYADHNHTTGQTRGLLCHHCNSFIGYARENVDNLTNAISYLREWS